MEFELDGFSGHHADALVRFEAQFVNVDVFRHIERQFRFGFRACVFSDVGDGPFLHCDQLTVCRSHALGVTCDCVQGRVFRHDLNETVRVLGFYVVIRVNCTDRNGDFLTVVTEDAQCFRLSFTQRCFFALDRRVDRLRPERHEAFTDLSRQEDRASSFQCGQDRGVPMDGRA